MQKESDFFGTVYTRFHHKEFVIRVVNTVLLAGSLKIYATLCIAGVLENYPLFCYIGVKGKTNFFSERNNGKEALFL